jgi:Tol biopolymer transport system component
MYLRESSGAGRLVLVSRNPYGGRDQYGDFSPDGSALVFMRGDPARDAAALFVVNTDGSGLRRITPWWLTGCCIVGWSPNGRWILFDMDGKLYLIHPDGTGLKQVRLHPGGRYFAFEPGFSPDGQRIVFSMYVYRLGQDDIYTANLDGSDLFQVTNTPEHEGQADWGTHPTVH